MLEVEFGTLEEVLEAINSRKRLEVARGVLVEVLKIAGPYVRDRSRFKFGCVDTNSPLTVIDYVDELVHIIERQKKSLETIVKINEIKDEEIGQLKDLIKLEGEEKAREKIRGWVPPQYPPESWKRWQEPSSDDCKDL